MKILIVEDEKHIYTPLRIGLESNGYAVDIAQNGNAGLELVRVNDYDVVILDLNLPGVDGVSVAKIMREEKINTPILMLTARSQMDDKITGLETGADDYMTKPFNFKELLLRVNNLIKRTNVIDDDILTVGDVELNPKSHSVTKGSALIKLNRKEFGILHYLLRNKSKVVSQEELIEHIWGSDESDSFSHTIRTQVLNLRKKIDPKRKLIETVKGVGYVIR